MYITLAGNIACGKTTMAKVLSEQLGYHLIKEKVEDNKFLDKYYQQADRWAFTLQTYFLNNRVKETSVAHKAYCNIISDRSIYEDKDIFARQQLDLGYMTPDEYETYLDFYHHLEFKIVKPDLLIYLYGSNDAIYQRYLNRSRDCEMVESFKDYLFGLNDIYTNWYQEFNDCKVIAFNIDEIDILENQEDLEFVLTQVKEALQA